MKYKIEVIATSTIEVEAINKEDALRQAEDEVGFNDDHWDFIQSSIVGESQ